MSVKVTKNGRFDYSVTIDGWHLLALYAAMVGFSMAIGARLF